MTIILAISFIVLLYLAVPPDKYNFYDYLKSKRLESYNQKHKQHLITCIYCQGTGERVEDVNLIMRDAKMALWLNKHLMVDKCSECVLHSEKYGYCDRVNDHYQVLLKEYNASGPKMENASCGECMGMGQFTSQKPDGKYLTQDEYEKRERQKNER